VNLLDIRTREGRNGEIVTVSPKELMREIMGQWPRQDLLVIYSPTGELSSRLLFSRTRF